MYDIALSVAACARSGTRADVAWMIAPQVSDEALAFTPGGGRIGGICGGAFDSLLAEVAGRQLSAGRRLVHSVTDVEGAMSGLVSGSTVEFLVVPASQFPADVWPLLLDRSAVSITTTMDGDVVTGVSISADTAGPSAASVVDGAITTVIAPVPRLIVAGQGPIAEALARQGELLGWKCVVEPRPAAVAGLGATLSPLDAIVVMGHDVEMSSTCLMAALESDAGYIGALGSQAMQESRATWLALRDVTDLERVHGPAGLDIGAGSPAQIAVSIAAQIIALAR